MVKSDPAAPTIGVILCDHGSRRPDADLAMRAFGRAYEQRGWFAIVEIAHMELEEPSIDEAFDRCVARGADVVVIAPLFFWPGKHWTSDIPELAADAASRHSSVPYLVAGPVGTHPLLADLVQARVEQCLAHADGGPACEVCEGADLCRFRR